MDSFDWEKIKENLLVPMNLLTILNPIHKYYDPLFLFLPFHLVLLNLFSCVLVCWCAGAVNTNYRLFFYDFSYQTRKKFD